MARKLPSGFEVLRFSDRKYKGMTTEVTFRGEQLAQLNMDKGASSIEIEILSTFKDKEFVPRFPLHDFLEALEVARVLLLEYPDPTEVPESVGSG